VYTSKLIPDSVVTYLFHDCERNLWLFCLVWRWSTLVCDDQSTVHTQMFAPMVCCRVLRVCALFERLTEFCFVFRLFLCLFAGIHVANRAVTLLVLLCMQSFRAFFSANTIAHVHRRRVCMSQFLWRVTVASPARPLCRMLCTGAWLTTDNLSAVSYDPLTHSRHNAGDKSAKVNHEINVVLNQRKHNNCPGKGFGFRHEAQNAPAYQISAKSDNVLLSYWQFN